MCQFLWTHAIHEVWDEDAPLLLLATPDEEEEEDEGEPEQPQRRRDSRRLDFVSGKVVDEYGTSHVVVEFTVHAAPGNPAAKLARRRPVVRDVCSPAAWADARRRIAECRSHKRCPRWKKSHLPSRVIDVGTPEHPQARLHIRQPGEQDHYLALSYCWGGDQPVKATTDTLDTLVAAIDHQRLPQTIRDAIECARQLGFRYLWVDALCILQDDDSDKAAEIANMSSIYKSAAVTIAASVAERAVDGFLASSAAYEFPCSFEFPMSRGRRGSVSLAKRDDPHHVLDHRGWTLQEFLLSPRLLLYSEFEALWQCLSCDLDGVSGRGLEYLQPLQGLPFGIFSDDAETITSTFGHAQPERLYHWKVIVEQYTGREISVKNDRVHAIDGVAMELKRLWGDEYVFGVWARWTVELLAWFQPQKQARRSTRAPSWSWMSLDHSICFEESFESVDATVLNESLLTLRDLSSLAIRGRLMPRDAIREEDLESIEEDTDLSTDEADGEETYYLLLGSTAVDDMRAGVGLVVISHDDSRPSFRRIGFAEFRDFGLWDGVEARRIILV